MEEIPENIEVEKARAIIEVQLIVVYKDVVRTWVVRNDMVALVVKVVHLKKELNSTTLLLQAF